MTGQLTHLTLDDLDVWRSYFDRLDSPGPYHDPEYLALLAGNFEHAREVPEAVVYEQGDGLVYYPYLRRPLTTLPFADRIDVDCGGLSDIVSSWYYGGPITTADSAEEIETAFLDAFGAHCREQDIVAEFIRFDPNRANHAEFESIEPIHNRKTVPVDLSGSPEDVWENYEARNRRAIDQARETDLVIERTRDQADIDRFHDIYSNAMAARDAAEHYRFEKQYFTDLLDRPDLATLYVARYGDDVVGGFITVHDERSAYHFLSASNPDYWDMRVNNLMYHEVVIDMQSRGRELFDFQGGRPGVFKFKKGFSPDRGEFYIGKQVHMAETYDRLVAAATEAGVDTETGYFPAYRVEQSN